VFAGEGRGELGALVFPADKHPREKFVEKLRSLESTGFSNRVTRVMLLEEPPSLDAGEMTDKGSINQRAVLAHRRHLVEELYSDSERVLKA
jgi:feruloyl-CoA synthase